ncbi:hypothetical protein OS493_012552 [Desmophyllum pertusum]|uniref:PLL-like beta propeller domain-containing protein n=1 Tax=Desmophyllum pertusum TaxID=174260 RepID=A0A9W9ZE95_9CNID|nr:hypothetical protein OS493_012552 [Desmophyllum pertusum]
MTSSRILFLFMLTMYTSTFLSHSRETSKGAMEDRLAVLENMRPPVEFVFAFHTNEGKLRYKQYLKGKWSSWQDMGSPEGKSVISNPVAAHDANNQTNVFCLCDDGQVYYKKQDADKLVDFGKWLALDGPKIPFEAGVTLNGKDTLSVLNYQKKLTVFSRSVTKASHLYWAQEVNGNWSGWALIGGSSVSLKSDVAVALNGFSKYLEAFAIMENNKMYRTWQTDPTKWVSWDETGYGAPETQHAPVVHQMSHSVFNGILNVFIYGNDGYLHHIWQTTCDKVPNPWGWCTWSVWYKISNTIPAAVPSSNPLSIGANIHLGIEVFTVGKEGGLWHMWELERGGVWNSWEFVGRPASAIASHPTIMNDDKGWWAAYALSAADDVDVVEQNRSLVLSASNVPFGSPVTASWTVPVDEATNKDWIGVYPSGADNHMYVDYYYVGGGQNPNKDAIPKGSLTFKSYLPNGKYDYRYLVNKRFFDAVSSSLTIFNATADKEWVQVYRGIAAGLGKEGFNFEKCVEDGNHTVALFKESFAAFQNNDIFKGLQLFGTALMDIVKAFEDCGETDIAKALEKIAKDFINCVEGNCVNFVIDAVKEILILFENVIEIYGDIQGASNSFQIKAYEQGGYCIGRVVDVCIAIPSHY